jgi:hypothetical protein
MQAIGIVQCFNALPRRKSTKKIETNNPIQE